MADLPMVELGIGLPNVWQTDTLFNEEPMTQPNLMGECFAAYTVYTNRVWDTQAGPGYVRWETGYVDSAGNQYPGPGTFGVHTSDYCVEYVDEVESASTPTACTDWVPSQHLIPGDTISHYTWQMSRLDTVNAYNFDQGAHSFAGIVDGVTSFVPAEYNYDNTPNTKNSPINNANFGFTFATCLYVPDFANGNADIVRFENTSGAPTHYRVGVVGNSGGTPGALYMGRDTSSGYEQYITPVAVFVFDEWIHFAWTQANDGLSGKFYINGTVVGSWSTANAPNSTSASALFCLGASWNTFLYGAYYSTITREKFCSDADIVAMAKQTGIIS